MLNYVSAELKRLKHKKSIYIYYGLLMLGFLSLFLFFEELRDIPTLKDILLNMISPLIYIFVGIQSFVAIYGDDLSNKTLSNVLSSGISKLSFLAGKIITMLLYLVSIYFCLGIVVIALYFVMGGEISTLFDLLIPLIKQGLVVMVAIVSTSSLVALVLYGAQKFSFGLIAMVMITLGFDGTILNLLGMVMDPIKDLMEYTQSTMVYVVTTTIAENKAIEMKYMLVFIGIIVVSTFINIYILKNKELEIN